MGKRRKKRRRKGPDHCYADRDFNLRAMGYASYQEYLQSDLWASIRARAAEVNGTVCRLCKKAAQVFHHRGYGRAVLRGESLRQLVPLCHRCHTCVEFKPDGTKRTLVEAHSAFIFFLKRSKNTLRQQRRRGEIP